MDIELVVFDLDTVASIGPDRVSSSFGIIPAFRRLRERRVRVALLSTRARRGTHEILARLGWLGGVVDACITTENGRRVAPDPEMVYLAMNVLGVGNAGRVAKVASSSAGVLQGTRAGCGLVVGIANRGGSEKNLRGVTCTQVLPTAALVPELVERAQATGMLGTTSLFRRPRRESNLRPTV